MTKARPMIYRDDRGIVPSDEVGDCADCRRTGYVSDWPGNDPANRAAKAARVRVLAVDTDGRLRCDRCARQRRQARSYDRLNGAPENDTDR